jgi:starvation-inducible DNA-binding protein
MSTAVLNKEKEKASLRNHLGLNNEAMEKLALHMNGLLSDYHIFYQNVRGFHWNIRGADFFDLHEKFEELYQLLSSQIDELAERIVSMGFVPLHSFSDFLENSRHKEQVNVNDSVRTVNHVKEELGMLIASSRSVVKMAAETGDIVSADMLTRFTGILEKQLWMFTKFGM